MARTGRPPYQPTDRDRQTVQVMIAGGIEHEKIARCLGIAPMTLRKHFRADIDTAAERANAQVAQSLFQAATSAVEYETTKDGRRVVKEVRPAGVTAAIWWSKTRMRWKEPPAETRITGKDGGPIETKDVSARDLLVEKLARLADRERDAEGEVGEGRPLPH